MYSSFESPKTEILTQYSKMGVSQSSEATDSFQRGPKHMADPVLMTAIVLAETSKWFLTKS